MHNNKNIKEQQDYLVGINVVDISHHNTSKIIITFYKTLVQKKEAEVKRLPPIECQVCTIVMLRSRVKLTMMFKRKREQTYLIQNTVIFFIHFFGE